MGGVGRRAVERWARPAVVNGAGGGRVLKDYSEVDVTEVGLTSKAGDVVGVSGDEGGAGYEGRRVVGTSARAVTTRRAEAWGGVASAPIAAHGGCRHSHVHIYIYIYVCICTLVCTLLACSKAKITMHYNIPYTTHRHHTPPPHNHHDHHTPSPMPPPALAPPQPPQTTGAAATTINNNTTHTRTQHHHRPHISTPNDRVLGWPPH